MTEEAKGVSEEGAEERSYTQIKEALESSDDATKGSTTPATQAPAPGATQAPQPAPSQQVVDAPKTLDEAKALLAKQQKQIDDSQSQIGKQSKDVGELRELVANLQGKVEAGVKPPPPEDKANESYVDQFKSMKSLEKVSDDNKQFLGIMFDKLRDDLKGSAGDGSMIQKLQTQVQMLQDQQTKQFWAAEATELATKHGKLYKDNVEAITEDMQRQMNEAITPSVTETFKRLTFDQALAQTQQPKPKGAKEQLNAEAALQPNTAPQEKYEAPVTTKGMNSKEKLRAIVADRKAKGLPL